MSSGTVYSQLPNVEMNGTGTLYLSMNFFNPIRKMLPYVKYMITEFMSQGRSQIKASIYAPNGVSTSWGQCLFASTFVSAAAHILACLLLGGALYC